MARSWSVALPGALALALGACHWHDPRRELRVSEIETYWIVDLPQQGENYISPAVRFHLTNIGPGPLSAVQARARFPAPDQDEPWGSIQEQVSTYEHPLVPGRPAIVTVRSVGRYHAAAAPEDILRSPGFHDPKVEIFVRIGPSSWAKLGEAVVERRIGAPETLKLGAP
jgi:hypothetical protein